MSRRIAALALVAVAALGLSACTGLPAGGGATGGAGADSSGDGGQTIAQACTLVQDTITQTASEFEQAAQQDPATVVAGMQAAAERIGSTASQVTNDQVAAILPSLQDMYAQLGDIMQSIGEGDVTRLADLASLTADFQETMQTYGELCPAG